MMPANRFSGNNDRSLQDVQVPQVAQLTSTAFNDRFMHSQPGQVCTADSPDSSRAGDARAQTDSHDDEAGRSDSSYEAQDITVLEGLGSGQSAAQHVHRLKRSDWFAPLGVGGGR